MSGGRVSAARGHRGPVARAHAHRGMPQVLQHRRHPLLPAGDRVRRRSGPHALHRAGAGRDRHTEEAGHPGGTPGLAGADQPALPVQHAQHHRLVLPPGWRARRGTAWWSSPSCSAATSSATGAWSACKEELDFVDSYLRFEQHRFGERLRIERDHEPVALSARVPPLVLQPIVENAVAHGVSEPGGTVDRVDPELRGWERRGHGRAGRWTGIGRGGSSEAQRTERARHRHAERAAAPAGSLRSGVRAHGEDAARGGHAGRDPGARRMPMSATRRGSGRPHSTSCGEADGWPCAASGASVKPRAVNPTIVKSARSRARKSR